MSCQAFRTHSSRRCQCGVASRQWGLQVNALSWVRGWCELHGRHASWLIQVAHSTFSWCLQGSQEPKETSSREGDQFQAAIPAQVGQRPAPGKEEDDPHCGIPGPSTEQALALAKGSELAAARALPPDATSDILLGTFGSHVHPMTCSGPRCIAPSGQLQTHALPEQSHRGNFEADSLARRLWISSNLLVPYSAVLPQSAAKIMLRVCPFLVLLLMDTSCLASISGVRWPEGLEKGIWQLLVQTCEDCGGGDPLGSISPTLSPFNSMHHG